MTLRPPRLDRVDLRLLRVFATVAECRGFSAAQVELGVGQSTISAQMSELEARLGMRLCDRGRGGFRLTEDGQLVYEAIQRLFRALDSFTSEVEARRGRLVGDLHIGTVDHVISNPACRLTEAIALFKDRESAVQLHLHVASPGEVERAVVDGRHHLGIGGYTHRAAGLEYVALFAEEHFLYCAPSHPIFEREDDSLSLDELKSMELVGRGYVRDPELPFGEWSRITARAQNLEAVAMLILTGRFIGFLPGHYADRWVRSGDMRPVRPDLLSYEAQLELILRRNRPPSSAAEAFLADIMSAHGVSAPSG